MNEESCRLEAQRVLKLEGQALLDCAERMSEKTHSQQFFLAVKTCKETLDQRGKIIVTGLGKSGKVGQKIAATFSSTGSLAVFIHPTEGLHGDLGLVAAQDTVLALSHSGNTQELLDLLPSLLARGVKVIGMGGNPQSRLAHQSHCWLDTHIQQEACPHNLAPTTSTTLALAMGDALAVALMKMRGINEASFAHNHPGGALGKKLLWKVSDLMHRANAVGTVTEEDGVEKIVQALTQKSLGGIIVVAKKDPKKMIGLITEGDLRRALREPQRFFSFKAKDLMTYQPVTVTGQSPLRDALALMEKPSGQISVLPVVNEKGEWEGLIRLHDLVQNL